MESQTAIKHPEYPDTVNRVVIVGDFGFNNLGGPYTYRMNNGIWEVDIPTEEIVSLAVLEDSVGECVVAFADGEPVSGGRITAVDEVEGDVVLAADSSPQSEVTG